jgi:hypothetical protein
VPPDLPVAQQTPKMQADLKLSCHAACGARIENVVRRLNCYGLLADRPPAASGRLTQQI